MAVIIFLFFVSSTGLCFGIDDVSDTDTADTTEEKADVRQPKSEAKDPESYRIGRTNLRINKKSDDYNWNTAGDEDAVNPLGTSYGVEW